MSEKTVPTVYAWCVGKFGHADESWCAMADDGELMATHVSSGRGWGQLDVHLNFSSRRAKYEQKFGGIGDDYYRFVVLPEGEQPPDEAMEANRRWAAEQESAS